MVKCECGIGCYKLADCFKDYKERGTYWKKVYPTLPMLLQMLIMLVDECRKADFLDWNFQFEKNDVELHKFMIECLKHFGYSLPETIPPEIFDFESDMYSLFKEDQREDEEWEDDE